jgi:hypothetical protein
MTTSVLDEERIGRLVGMLEPVPVGWVQAAQEIPVLYRSIDEILARAEADAAFRPALIANLEQALAEAGYQPEPRLLAELRKRLA